jgi:hypothetical protein
MRKESEATENTEKVNKQRKIGRTGFRLGIKITI